MRYRLRAIKTRQICTVACEFVQNADAGWWNSVANQRKYTEWLRLREGKQLADLPKTWSFAHLRKNQGGPLVERYDCMKRLLMTIYPEHEWGFRLVKPPGYWKDINNQKEFWEWLTYQRLGFTSMDEWYNVNTQDVLSNGGYGFLKENNFSIVNALLRLYPSHKWQIWKFTQLPAHSWKDITLVSEYIKWVEEQMQIRNKEDWYNVTLASLIKFKGASSVLKEYGNSLYNVLRAVYPEHDWHPWLFRAIPNGFFQDEKNCRQYIQWLMAKLGLETMDDWYNVSNKVLYQNNGGALLKTHHTLYNVLKRLYPNHLWHPWKFASLPSSYWNQRRHRAEFFKHIMHVKGWTSLENFYAIDSKLVKQLGGTNLLKRFNDSVIKAVIDAFPEHNWEEWRFERVPLRWWNNRKHIRKYLDWLFQELKLKSMDDWYYVTNEQLISNYGSALLRKYKYVKSKILQDAYSDHNWEPWKFQTRNFWQKAALEHDTKSLQWIITQLADKFNLNNPIQWSLLTSRQLGAINYKLAPFGGLTKALQILYPTVQWNECLFRSSTKRSTQRLVYSLLSARFPNIRITMEHNFADLQFEVDCLLEERVAIEYQGVRHYLDTTSFGERDIQTERDCVKAVHCATRNVHLVEIPYWWNGSMDDLERVIRVMNPEILK